MRDKVTPKKRLGQHFLKDENIASKIVNALEVEKSEKILEIGPGMGVLTKYLEPKYDHLYLSEIDQESVVYLKKHFPKLENRIIEGDFLKTDILSITNANQLSVIGNFPYNISSQIFFRVLDLRNNVNEVVGMIQKEVAERIASPPGNKTYGILSVLLQAYFKIDYLFTVNENVFNPPPKVKSAVIRLKRNKCKKLNCDEKLFFRIVKQGFNNRRKTLRNALKALNLPLNEVDSELLSKRAEQLGVEDFEKLTNQVLHAV